MAEREESYKIGGHSRLIIFCNICVFPSRTVSLKDRREGHICIRCKSNARQRLIQFAVDSVSKRVAKRNGDFRVIGVSDSEVTSLALSRRLGSKYKNYQYHEEPFLDITKPGLSLFSSADIVICSEVLEHVPAPVGLAFDGLAKILKASGTLIISVPHSLKNSRHIEHFLELRNPELIDGSKYRGQTVEGKIITYENLVFHGGAGATLEHRVFSEESLIRELEKAGFQNLKKLGNKKLFGIDFEPWSRVWIATKA